MTLRTLLGTHPGTEAVKSGRVSSPLVAFDYDAVKVANTRFKAMMRDAAYDLGEIAIATFLQAYESGTPYLLLPATIVGRHQHHTIFYNADRGPLAPGDLSGKRVGVRAYTQTTGAWVRGFLAEDHGVDLQSVTWITFEDPHVAGYQEPANVVRAGGTDLTQMLLGGEIDAAVLGDVAAEGPLRHLFPDPAAAGERWARAHGGVPINHMAAIRAAIAESHPEVLRAVYRLLRESRLAATGLPGGADDPVRFGVGATRQSLEQMVAYAFDQRLITRRPSADELFAGAIRILGDAAA